MGNNKKMMLKIFVLMLFIPAGMCDGQPSVIDPSLLTQTKSLGDCRACKMFIESFKKGLERTSRGKFEGGDAAWEEEKLKTSYRRSEMRLIDIQDSLCKEESDYSVQCHHMAEKAEEFIEEWWAQDPDETIDFLTYICIDRLRVCCPQHHYGADCKPCPGDHSNICNGNGKCRGEGTRKGNGTCLCNNGYMGKNCDQCSMDYYMSYKSDNKIICSPCHQSCLGGCRENSQKDCVACKPGFTLDPDEGCVDIDECENEHICENNEFCMNSLGSFSCFDCDNACDQCYGMGPDSCIACAVGYSKKGEFCIADRAEDYADIVFNGTRYFTYFGLLVATGILLPNSTAWGTFVGILVFTYIVGSEYYSMINGHEGLFKLKDFDIMQHLMV